MNRKESQDLHCVHGWSWPRNYFNSKIFPIYGRKESQDLHCVHWLTDWLIVMRVQCIHVVLCLKIIQCIDLPLLQKAPNLHTLHWCANWLMLRWHWMRFASFSTWQLRSSKTIKPVPGPTLRNSVAVVPDVETQHNKCKKMKLDKSSSYS